VTNEKLCVVYLVTHRRHSLLKRALASVCNQTHKTVRVYVVNDDPKDDAVAKIVLDFRDERLRLFKPVAKRGVAANFNLVFREAQADYVSLLEDDNWWERNFLERQIEILERYPEAPLVVANERVWRECSDRSWENTGKTIWPFQDVRFHTFSLGEIAGSARICNSSLLVRVDRAEPLLTPEAIPPDVTEHFRDRLLPRTIPLNGAPLVNFGQTLTTARDSGERWSIYQVLLVGSVFAALPAAARGPFASRLWHDVLSGSPRATTLVQTGLAIREARSLLASARRGALVRAAISIARHPGALLRLASERQTLKKDFDFLVSAPLTRQLAQMEAQQERMSPLGKSVRY
jgi:hypothetical protein